MRGKKPKTSAHDKSCPHLFLLGDHDVVGVPVHKSISNEAEMRI